jgi:hypothetical protein
MMRIYTPRERSDIKECIAREGYAVVNVMTSKRASIFLHQLQKFVKDSNIPATLLTRGIIKSHGIGQADFMWKIRNVRNVKSVFANLCECKHNHLLPSFDGACYVPIDESNSTTLWPHRDQHPSNTGVDTYQGSLCLAESDGGFMCWPKSHLIEDWSYKHENAYVDYFSVPLSSAEAIAEKNAKKICPPPGTLLVWDSRMIHCNFPPKKKGPRAVAFVCMVDGRDASEEVLAKREFCMANNITTSHHPLRFRMNEI